MAASVSFLLVLTCRSASPGEGTRQAHGVPTALQTSGLSAPAGSEQFRGSHRGLSVLTAVDGSRVHFLGGKGTLGSRHPHPDPLCPCPHHRAAFVSSPAWSFPASQLPFLNPSLTASLIRQMQSVGRPSPLAAKQPPLISARVYRIST